MSIKIMTQVFKDENLEPNKKLIMLALSDNANDEGYCYPSINTLIKKTSLSKPTIIKHIKELEKMGFLLSKERIRRNGSAMSKIYVIYPAEYFEKLDEELKSKFTENMVNNEGGSKEALPPKGSKEVLPGGSKEALPGSKEALPREPSIKPSSLFNHHLFNKLNKEEKELFLEYIKLRKKMKLQTTLSIQDRLLNKYFKYGRDIEIIEKAIINNWKDFYEVKKTHTNATNFNSKSKNNDIVETNMSEAQRAIEMRRARLKAKGEYNE